MILSGLCFSCSSPVSSNSQVLEEPSFEIYIEKAENTFEFESPNPVTVKRGENATFKVRMNRGYAYDSLKRKGVDVDAPYRIEEDSTATFTIPNVRFSAVYTLFTHDAEQSIFYYTNGGEYLSGSNPFSPYEVAYSLKHRLRPNTEIGTNRIKRDGYLLTGWNLAEDGSGERVGLGSRVTLQNDQMLSLYAMWEKYSPSEEFEVKDVGGDLSIISYLGNREKVVIPAQIDGKEVISIANKAFHGQEKTVYLPPSIRNIEDGAFHNSDLKELYFYDNIHSISDEIVENCKDFSTIHINAIVAPRYGGHNLVSEVNLADKYDILILNKDKPKLLVFGGSGAYNSVNTNLMEKAFTDERVCINMAVNGWFNGVAQFEMMRAFVKDGDILLHAPETSSQFSLLYGIEMAPEIGDFNYNKTRFYSCVESNYDLWSLVDFRDVKGLLTGFNEFQKARANLPPTTYEDYKTTVTLYGKTYHEDLAYIDMRGNFALPKPAKAGLNYAGEADIVVEYVSTPAAYNRLNAMYQSYRNRGVDVYFSNAPINGDTLWERFNDPESFHRANSGNFLYFGRPEGIPDPSYPSFADWVEDFESQVKQNLDATVILPLSETMYSTEAFFEPDYHLCDEVGASYTEDLIGGLRAKRGGSL